MCEITFKLSIQQLLMNLLFLQSKVLTTNYNTKATQKNICLGSLLQMTSIHPDTKTKSNILINLCINLMILWAENSM